MEFLKRLFGAMFLNVDTYEEVEANPKLTSEAFWVIVIVSISAAVAQANGGFLTLIFEFLGTALSWVVMAVIIFLLGTKAFPESGTDSSVGEVLRTTGYGYAPGIFAFLGIIPFLGGLAKLVIFVWTLCCVIVGIRQALDYESTGRAVMVCFVAWLCALPFNAISWVMKAI